MRLNYKNTKQLVVGLAVTTALTGCGNPDGVYHEALEWFGARTQYKNPIPPSSQIQAIHNAAPFIVDLHADTLLHPDAGGDDGYRLLVNEEREGHVDINRMIEGNVAMEVFAAASKGSLDIAGDTIPWITGYYTDDDGVKHSRYNYVRDPNVWEYDDENSPYAEHYAWVSMERDLATYFYRVSGMPCTTWYEDGGWSLDWGITPECTEFDPERMYIVRLLETAKKLHRAANLDSRIKLIKAQSDLDDLITRRQNGEALVGAMLSTEGIYFRSDVSTPEGEAALTSAYHELYDAGFRMFALTHFIDNDYGGSSTGMARAHDELGLGREIKAEGLHFAKEVVDNNTILDLAHASRATFVNLVDYALERNVPVVVSHTGLAEIPGTDETCRNSRNLYDQEIINVAATGGVIGIGFAEAFICDTKPIAWAKAVRHAVDVITDAGLTVTDAGCAESGADNCTTLVNGVDHVALGTDYDGGVETYTDIDSLNQYTEALICEKTWWKTNCLDNPFTVEEAYKILGGNSLAVMRKILPQ
ncbi:MAG: hypothetical protein GY938_00270 [Ketobacter sp.]|nr:hypothetical protein [Ketobacter sp.]